MYDAIFRSIDTASAIATQKERIGRDLEIRPLLGTYALWRYLNDR
jgi:hypothetical protein